MDLKGAKINVVYSGTDVRFLFPSGKYTLKFDGTGIDISAVGKGTLRRRPRARSTTARSSVNGAKARPARLGRDLRRPRWQCAGVADKATGSTTPSSSTGR